MPRGLRSEDVGSVATRSVNALSSESTVVCAPLNGNATGRYAARELEMNSWIHLDLALVLGSCTWSDALVRKDGRNSKGAPESPRGSIILTDTQTS
jgi:hypothetical protein